VALAKLFFLVYFCPGPKGRLLFHVTRGPVMGYDAFLRFSFIWHWIWLNTKYMESKYLAYSAILRSITLSFWSMTLSRHRVINSNRCYIKFLLSDSRCQNKSVIDCIQCQCFFKKKVQKRRRNQSIIPWLSNCKSRELAGRLSERETLRWFYSGPINPEKM